MNKKEIKDLQKQALLDVWECFQEYFKKEKIKKSELINYLSKLEATDTIDNLFFNQGYLQALEDVSNEIQRSEIRQGRSNL